MKKVIIFCLAATMLFAASFTSSSVSALSGSEWRAGRIIDDPIFRRNTSMSVGEIQAFLNSKVPSCDTNGIKPSEYSGGTRAQYGTSRGYPPPYVCLKDYWENVDTKQNNLEGRPVPAGAKSAAQIIYDYAQAYTINPQVLIVLLQKEQGLVTDDWPWTIQYRSATGYGCPDTAPCDSQYYGFSNQVRWAARMFQAIMDNDPNWFTPYTTGNNFIRWNPNASCDGSNVNIENRATAALYNYTPYQPNQAALNNLYGTGDGCSSYGNRNFWRYFSDWFGATTGPDYAWTIQSFSYSGGDNRINIGETETITLQARNIGRVPWYNSGPHPMRLGTWDPPDRMSSLFGTSRLATMTESVVQPYEIGTFTFTVTPTREGVFAEDINLVAENLTWAASPGLRPTIIVPTAYEWQIQNVLYEKGTGEMDPGTKQLITVIAKNIGSATWHKSGGTPIRLGTWTPTRPSAVSATWPSAVRAADMNEDTVAPGQTAGFQFYVTLPASGLFYERLNLVAEGQRWFNDAGLTLYLRGKNYAWQPLWHWHSTGTANIPRNTEFTLTVRAKNTGEVTWTKDTYPVRLATAGPHNRGSGLYHPSWINDTRPAVLQENSVAPGQEGTFIFTARTPPTPGARAERFTLVAEGVAWFNDPGFSIYVNVL